MRVLRNYFYSIGYQVLNVILPLITGPYVARVLGPTGVGINTYTGAVIQYFVLVAGLGIVYYGNRQIAYASNDRHARSVAFWEIQIIKTSTTFLAFVAFLIYLFWVKEYKFYLIIQSAYIVATGFDISWLYEGIQDFKKTFTRNTGVRIGSFILILALVHKPQDVWLYILILAGSNLAGYIALWPSISRILEPVKISSLHPTKHVRGIISLFVPYIALSIYPVLNKTFLKHFVGIDASGFYEKSDVMIRMALTVVTSISLVLLPYSSKALADGKVSHVKNVLVKSFNYVSFLALPIAFGMSAIAPRFGVFFYGHGFTPVGPAMAIESFAIIFMGWSSITGNQYLIPTNNSAVYTRSVLAGTLVNVFAGIPLIIKFGLNGAAIATLLSEFVISVYQFVAIRHDVSFWTLRSDICKYLLAAILMFVGVFGFYKLFQMNVFNFPLTILLGICIYFLALIILRPTVLVEIKKIFKAIKTKK